MKILCTNNALVARAGSESYLETIAPALRQLGHDVEFYSPRCGPFAETLRGRGFRVHDDPDTISVDFDVIHGQHLNALAMVRPRLSGTPLIFATHSWFIPIEDPAAELGAASFIAFNDITYARIRAHAAVADRPVHRMRQPIEVSFADRTRTPLPSRASLAVAASRNLSRRLPELRAACERHGISLQVVGSEGAESPDARREIRAADLVVAIGRTALEGMAAGRAVLVLDEATVGGWVTSESYARLEADGFTGYHPGPDGESLDDLIAGYRPELGSVARILAVRHHAAQRHAVELVGIYRAAAESKPVPARVDPQLASLADASLALESRAVGAEWANAESHRERLLLDQDLVTTRAQLAVARAQLAVARAQLAVAREQVTRITASRSWRVTAAARHAGRAARKVLSRGGPVATQGPEPGAGSSAP